MTYQPPLNGKRISIKADANPAIESGEVTLASGSNITLDQSGNTITIDSTLEGGSGGGDVEDVGVIKMYAGASAPTGWHLCDGSAVSRETYADLFTAIGTTYGSGDGSTTFNLPNLQGRVPVGLDSGQTEFDSLGETGGAKTHQLTVGEMPSHTHTQDAHTHTQNAHTHTQNSHNHTQDSHTHTGPSHTHSGTSLSISVTDIMEDVLSTYDTIDISRGSGTSAESSSASFTVGTGTMQHGERGTGDRLGSGSSGAARIRFLTRHSHSVTGSTGSGGTGNTGSTTATNNAATATNQNTTATNQNTTATNQNTGGDGAHNNLQPYIVVNYIIKMLSGPVGEGSLPEGLTLTDGKLGIGTETPDAYLHILADDATYVPGIKIENTSSGADAYSALTINTDTHWFEIGSGGSGTSLADTLYIYDGDADLVRLALDGDGNFGIGTDDPGHRLDVFDDTATSGGNYNKIAGFLSTGLASTALSQIFFGAADSFRNAAEFNFYYDGAGSTANQLRIGLNGVSGLTLQGDGNTGIGTTNPVNRFQVTTSGTGSPYIGINNTGANVYQELQRWSGVASTYWGSRILNSDTGLFLQRTAADADIGSQTFADVVSMLNNGDVGIGVSSPKAQLHVQNGSSGFAGSPNFRTVAVFEGSNSNGTAISILAPSSGVSVIYFGDESLETDAQIQYTHSTQTLSFLTNGGGHNDFVYTSGRVGIGDTSPDFKLDVEANGATVAQFNRLSSDGTVVSIAQAGTEEGTISVSGTTVSYNAFTGSHYAWTDQSIERGMLVALTGTNRRLHSRPDSEPLYGVVKATVANDPKILGSYLSLLNPEDPADDSNPHQVMSVGNGDMWVVESGGDLAPGDELISSATAGHAMKDPGTYAVANVIARAAEPIRWDEVTEAIDGKKRKKITVFFGAYARPGHGSMPAAEPAEEPATETQENQSPEESAAPAPAGQVVIPAGATTFDVTTDALTPDSLIFVTPNKPVAIGAEPKDATTFTISLQAAHDTDLKVNWRLVG